MNEVTVRGRRLQGLHFGSTSGKKLSGVILRSGKVFRPSPYNLPALPYKVLAFALNMVLAMLDTGLVNDEHFDGNRARCSRFREEVLSLLRRIESDALLGTYPVPRDPIDYHCPS